MQAFFGHPRFVTVVSFSVVAGKVALCRVNGDINITTSDYYVVHYHCTLFWSWHMVIVGLLSLYLRWRGRCYRHVRFQGTDILPKG